MANKEHVEILKQGVEIWHQWRVKHGHIVPDLSRANLRGIDLSGANLIGVDLSGANLFEAILIEANLMAAYVAEAVLSRANLSGANLGNTSHFGYTSFATTPNGANLSKANLTGANLAMTVFNRTILSGTNLSRSIVHSTTFRDVDLSEVKGLDTLRHRGPSFIDIHTMNSSKGRIPKVFLQGVGLPDSFITSNSR